MASSRDRDSFRRDRRDRSRSRDRSKRSRSRERNRNDGGDGGDRNYRNDRNFNRRGDDDRKTDRNYGSGDRQPTDADGFSGGFIPGGDKRTRSPNIRGLDDGSDPKRQKSGRNENHGSRRENERFDRTRIEDGGRQNFDRGMWNRSRNGADDLEGNTNNYDDRRGQPRFNREYVNNRRFGDSGYGQRGSAFGRRGFNRNRGGRGGGTTVVYRPGEEDDKPKLNLFNPTDVPKGRSYFEHDDRAAGARIGRGRGRGNFFGPRLNRNTFSSHEQTSSTDCWSHDMFKMEEEEKIEQQS